MQDIKNKIEAILFTTGRFMNVEELSAACRIGSVGAVKEALLSLIEDYRRKEGALEIFEDAGKYKLGIKKSYNYLTISLLDDSELDRPTQETLAIIAYRNPVVQSDLIKIRGNGAYDHIKKLKELGFVISEKHGRTRKLKLTQKFFDYFDIIDASQLGEKFRAIAERVRSLAKEESPKEESAAAKEESSGQEGCESPEEAEEESAEKEPEENKEEKHEEGA